jgi:GNAT superfamily N-acetyltransferase
MTWARLKELARTPRLLLAQKLLRRVPLRPVDIGKLCFLQLDRLPQVATAMLRGHADVRFATLDDLDALTRLQDKGALYRQRFAEGDRCVVALVGDRIIGFEWFSESASHHETGWGYRITIPGGYVYAYDAFIDPAYRNTGVWLRFKAHLADWMAARGKHGVLTFVDYGNWPSLRTHLRFGFQPADTVVALRVLGIRFFRKVRAASVATWSYVAWLAMHQLPLHLHHATRVLHVALNITRR